MGYRLSKDAEDDLVGIWRYTCQSWGETQADKYLDELDSICSRISTGNLIVKEMPEIHPDLRYCHHQRHYVFWLNAPQPVVVAFLHDNMKLVKHLEKRV